MDKSAQQLVAGGVLVVVLAVAGGVYWKSSQPACALTSAGFGAIIQGVTRGKSAGAILAGGAAGALIPEVCRHVIESLITDPQSEVEFVLDTHQGETEIEAVGEELLAPPPPPPTVPDFSRMVDCIGWNSQFLYDMCVDRELPPPPPSSITTP